MTTNLLTYFSYLISLWIGFALISLLKPKSERIHLSLHLILATGIGLGISASIVFLSLIIFKHLHIDFIVLVHLILLVSLHTLYFLNHKNFDLYKFNKESFKELIPLLIIILASLFFWVHTHFYAYGGWDAWSVWNLKARFIFLGGNEWTKLFDPMLWRSSPHYPLLLPLIINWGWILQDSPVLEAPIFTGFLFTFLTLSLLFVTLKELTRSWYSLIAPLLLLSLPFYVKIALSQYCDILVSFYTLASVACLIFAKRYTSKTFIILAGIFLGILAFSKPEGLAATAILAVFFIPYMKWQNKEFAIKSSLYFYLSFLAALIPFLIFKFFYAPDNITMINGLTSDVKPVSFFRLKMIFSFYFVELFGFPKNGQWLLNPNWHLTWYLLIAAILGGIKQAFKKETIIIPMFLFSYMAITTFYYFINTYFKIDWWLQVTLHRVLFAMIPVVVFWTFLSLWGIAEQIIEEKKTVQRKQKTKD